MWDTQAIAEAYHASVYNEVLRIPASVVTAKPAKHGQLKTGHSD